MPRYLLDDSESESEYSETDESYRSPGRHRIKRHSFSRSRRRISPDSNSYLSPNVISTVRRSASTGNRRRPREDPMVIVDVHNDVRNRQESRDRHDRHERHDRHDRHDKFIEEDDEIEIIRPHRRLRAVSNVSAPRTPSPIQQQRDWELLVDQRILAKNDIRQDLEIAKQKQEIDRLERQLGKSKERHREDRRESHSRHRYDEVIYEDDLADKLRKLERLEKLKRNEEEQRLADQRAKIKRLEEAERRAAEEEEAKRLAHEAHLKEIEKREAIKAEKERIKKELRDEEARKALEEEERKKEMMKLEAQAIEKWKRNEEAKRMREIEEKKKKDDEFRERLKADFGLTEEEIEKRLKKKDEDEKKKHGESGLVILDPGREKTTYIKVHKKYLLPQTLEAYRLPWDWDNVSFPSFLLLYILIQL
ncbi:hypothetical protein BGW36DRAFT_378801 [Talaromyces proteolyticus]|uniref:Uncharacterized protein n=1 Tax=Talaromyces proteolyticus TaxID=1131652 RepID=A0AAD4KV91_9EURO|nr:uncharacterized protein BGW36DRAFT_378801 [Talaromyces proteolyticus]KAH8697491.1 hypothetical protein BGW36DRAFT_378801 [Talaromyces proteolyticus]